MRGMLRTGLVMLLVIGGIVSAQAQTGACPGFTTRLSIGGQAEVTPGPPVNLRAAPGINTDSTGQIQPGEVFSVLDGPVCADDLTWWQVGYAGSVGWIAEGDSNSYWLMPVGAGGSGGSDPADDIDNLLNALGVALGGGFGGSGCRFLFVENLLSQSAYAEQWIEICVMPGDRVGDVHAISPSGQRVELIQETYDFPDSERGRRGIDGIGYTLPPQAYAEEGTWTLYGLRGSRSYEIRYTEPTKRKYSETQMLYAGFPPNETLTFQMKDGSRTERVTDNTGKLIVDNALHDQTKFVVSPTAFMMTDEFEQSVIALERTGDTVDLMLGSDTTEPVLRDVVLYGGSVPNPATFTCPGGQPPLITFEDYDKYAVYATVAQSAYEARDVTAQVVASFTAGDEVPVSRTIECGEDGITWRQLTLVDDDNTLRRGWIIESTSEGYYLEAPDAPVRPSAGRAISTGTVRNPAVTGFDCPGAYVSGFEIGDRFVVPFGDGPTNLRLAPNWTVGNMTEPILEGQGGIILEGPRCAEGLRGNLVAWYVRSDNGDEGWITAGYPTSNPKWIVPEGSVASSAVTCPGFMTSRLVAGQQAYVIPGMGPNSLRTLPRHYDDDQYILDIPENGIVMVLDGPICDTDSGIAWWEVNYNGTVGWTGEGQASTYWLEPIP